MNTDKECLRVILDALLDNEETRERLIVVMRQDLLKALEPTEFLRGILVDLTEAHDTFTKFAADNLIKEDSAVKLPVEVRDKMLKAYNARHSLVDIWRQFTKDINKYGLLDDDDQ